MLTYTEIAAPEPELTPDHLIARARGMRETLRARQAECEALGRLPDVTNDEFVAAGFYRTLQPRRFGGYEFDVPTFVEVMSEVARGCPSSGWVVALTSGHPHTLSYFGEEAQAEAYGDRGEFRAPFVATPLFGQRAEGGYVVSGGWDYASGCDVATHFLGHVIIPPQQQGGPPVAIIALIDRGDFEIVDNWDVVGMRGTGSRRVVVKDLFVPERRRTTSMLLLGGEVLPSIHANPMYRGRPLSLLMMEIAAVSVGIASAALDAYEEILRTKKVRGPISPLRFESPDYQRHWGDATAMIEMARATLRQIAREYMALCERQASGGEAFGDIDDYRLLILEQEIGKRCFEAVTLLFQTGGSSSGKSGSELGRYMRDMSFVMTHMGLEPDRWREGYGKLWFGVPLPVFG